MQPTIRKGLLWSLLLLGLINCSVPEPEADQSLVLATELTTKPDTLARFERPDVTQIAVNGRGPANKPIAVSRGTQPTRKTFTYDAQGRLLASLEPTVFGYEYYLGVYQQNRLVQVYWATNQSALSPASYSQNVIRYRYNGENQIGQVLHYQRLKDGEGQYRLVQVDEYQYDAAGSVATNRRTTLADSSYQITTWSQGKPASTKRFSRQGTLDDATEYTYDDKRNPYAGLYFPGLDPSNMGYASNLIETKGQFGVYRREYKLDYDAAGRIAARSIRLTPNDPWTVEYQFYYGQ
ncbi:hypothetical protein [Spirosoma sp. 209]|uniref:hypothetical protein n=1 Tax=Spirosoma sp. 209 TaxID=1955701 RepID=UPI001374710D|nr:hypothetical protein [Spirosoma sp. 209]